MRSRRKNNNRSIAASQKKIGNAESNLESGKVNSRYVSGFKRKRRGSEDGFVQNPSPEPGQELIRVWGPDGTSQDAIEYYPLQSQITED